ncbi:MAG: M15 family metallopeptidase [Acidimicrobiales bacterium]
MPTPGQRTRRGRVAMAVVTLALSAIAAAACSTTSAATESQERSAPESVPAAADAAAPEEPRGMGRAEVPASPDVDAPPVWVVGSELLPLRPDGFAEIGPTPDVLVDRRLPTPGGTLAPPPDDQFASTVAPIDDEVRARMGRTWSPGCPVALEDLRHVTVSFWGFDGHHHTGDLVVHREVADDVVWVFSQLHAERFPLEEVRLITDADLDAPATGDGNLTAAYICRPVRSGSTWSEHAYGRAVDVNPFHNPYVRGDVVLPERASAYLDRDHVRPGMIRAGDVVTESFAAIGWHWGGTWASPDHMHFSSTGR